MAKQLVYTSAPQGLWPGATGYCTVLCTEGISRGLADFLEKNSVFRITDRQNGVLISPTPDQYERLVEINPSNFAHLQFSFGGKEIDVLARTCLAGFDYSGRLRKLSHFHVLDEADKTEAGPGWVSQQPNVFLGNWGAKPTMLTEEKKLPEGSVAPSPCRTWQQAAGDAGYAGILASSIADRERPVYIVVDGAADVVALLQEAIAILPPDRRWEVTFATRYFSLPQGVTCQWRFVRSDSPEWKQAQQLGKKLVIDLTSSLPPLPNSVEAEAARRGGILDLFKPDYAPRFSGRGASSPAESSYSFGAAFSASATPGGEAASVWNPLMREFSPPPPAFFDPPVEIAAPGDVTEEIPEQEASSLASSKKWLSVLVATALGGVSITAIVLIGMVIASYIMQKPPQGANDGIDVYCSQLESSEQNFLRNDKSHQPNSELSVATIQDSPNGTVSRLQGAAAAVQLPLHYGVVTVWPDGRYCYKPKESVRKENKPLTDEFYYTPQDMKNLCAKTPTKVTISIKSGITVKGDLAIAFPNDLQSQIEKQLTTMPQVAHYDLPFDPLDYVGGAEKRELQVSLEPAQSQRFAIKQENGVFWYRTRITDLIARTYGLEHPDDQIGFVVTRRSNSADQVTFRLRVKTPKFRIKPLLQSKDSIPVWNVEEKNPQYLTMDFLNAIFVNAQLGIAKSDPLTITEIQGQPLRFDGKNFEVGTQQKGRLVLNKFGQLSYEPPFETPPAGLDDAFTFVAANQGGSQSVTLRIHYLPKAAPPDLAQQIKQLALKWTDSGTMYDVEGRLIGYLPLPSLERGIELPDALTRYIELNLITALASEANQERLELEKVDASWQVLLYSKQPGPNLKPTHSATLIAKNNVLKLIWSGGASTEEKEKVKQLASVSLLSYSARGVSGGKTYLYQFFAPRSLENLKPIPYSDFKPNKEIDNQPSYELIKPEELKKIVPERLLASDKFELMMIPTELSADSLKEKPGWNSEVAAIIYPVLPKCKLQLLKTKMDLHLVLTSTRNDLDKAVTEQLSKRPNVGDLSKDFKDKIKRDVRDSITFTPSGQFVAKTGNQFFLLVPSIPPAPENPFK